jgi:dolichol-phosphate mannosyltransferase
MITILIPTFNEAENIKELLSRLQKTLDRMDYRVLVVDDNSTDGTADQVRSVRSDRIGIMVRLDKKGIGSALQDGVKEALKDTSCTAIVTMDSDLSHRVEDMPAILDAGQHSDVVVGSRYVPGGTISGWSLRRRILSRGANIICRTLVGTGVRDNTSNYRLYTRSCAGSILTQDQFDEGYAWLVETITACHRSGHRITEVPIHFVERIRGESKIHSAELLRWAAAILRLTLDRIF